MKSDRENFAYAVSRFFLLYLPGERGFSENTIASYRDTFKQLLMYCKREKGIEPDRLTLSDFSRELVIGFLAELEKDGKSAATRNQRLAAIKSFFGYVKFAFPDYLHVSQSILGVRMKRQPEPTVNYLTVDGISTLLRQPDASCRSGYRDMLMLTLLYDSGARVSELTKICIGDIRLPPPATIVLHGKGCKDRIVPLSTKTADLIANYINQEHLSKPESKGKPLFTNRQGTQLTRIGVTYVLKKYTDMAHCEQPNNFSENLSAHCIRHSKAMHLLQAGVPLIYIRDFLGHSKISTTEIYAKADSESKRKALEAAYSPTMDFDNSKPTWNDDPSLMKFLEALCKR